jgi:hypothetical protein
MKLVNQLNNPTMQFNKTLPILFLSILFFCSFLPASTSKQLRIPVTGDLYFINNTNQLVSAAVFQTSVQTKIFTNFAPGSSVSDVISFQNNGDNFTYIITFTTPTPQAYTVTTEVGNVFEIKDVPAGVTFFTFTTPIPQAVGGIRVFLDIK